VRPGQGGRPPKYASAHDLRRSLAERLYDAGVPEREVSRVMRHADPQTTRRHYAPGTVQKAAGILRERLTTTSDGQPNSHVPRYMSTSESS
jgi:integrase